MCVSVLSACVPHGVQYQQRPSHKIPLGVEVTYGYEPPCESWELNLGLLEERPVLLNNLSSLEVKFKTIIYIT